MVEVLPSPSGPSSFIPLRAFTGTYQLFSRKVATQVAGVVVYVYT